LNAAENHAQTSPEIDVRDVPTTLELGDLASELRLLLTHRKTRLKIHASGDFTFGAAKKLIASSCAGVHNVAECGVLCRSLGAHASSASRLRIITGGREPSDNTHVARSPRGSCTVLKGLLMWSAAAHEDRALESEAYRAKKKLDESDSSLSRLEKNVSHRLFDSAALNIELCKIEAEVHDIILTLRAAQNEAATISDGSQVASLKLELIRIQLERAQQLIKRTDKVRHILIDSNAQHT